MKYSSYQHSFVILGWLVYWVVVDYVNSQGNVKAGTTVFASPLSISLSFTFLKLFLFT